MLSHFLSSFPFTRGLLYLKMRALGSRRASVPLYQITPFYIPKTVNFSLLSFSSGEHVRSWLSTDWKCRGNWQMECVASTLHTTSEHGVSSITTADAHTSAASSRLNWRPRRFKWTRLFRRKKKSGFCACAITFQLVSASFKGVL